MGEKYCIYYKQTFDLVYPPLIEEKKNDATKINDINEKVGRMKKMEWK